MCDNILQFQRNKMESKKFSENCKCSNYVDVADADMHIQSPVENYFSYRGEYVILCWKQSTCCARLHFRIKKTPLSICI